MPICSAALKRSPAWSRAPQATVGEPRAQDEGRLGEVTPTKLSGDARPDQRHSRSGHAVQSFKPTLGLQFIRSTERWRLQAPLNPNSVLLGKTDDEGSEAARGLRGRPRARAGWLRLGRGQRRRRCGYDDERHNDRGRRLQPLLSQAKLSTPGAVSSVGRAPARQAGGHWFEPSTAHLTKAPLRRGFFVSPAAPVTGSLRPCGNRMATFARRTVMVSCA